jgi:hypothetical protein
MIDPEDLTGINDALLICRMYGKYIPEITGSHPWHQTGGTVYRDRDQRVDTQERGV